MNKKDSTLFVLFLGVVSLVGAQVCEVCVPTGGNSSEVTAIQDSLTNLGFSFQSADDPTATACDVYITYPSSNYIDSGTALPWVQAGNGLVQISDHGPDLQINSWTNVGAGNPPQTVTVVDAGHPIAAGVSGSWQTFGFWHYGITDDYIGWVTDPDPNIAQISGNDRGLSARAEGAGRVVYIGWNVYGTDATADDLTILRQAIEWSGNCSVPVELMSFIVE
ncbi:MAG: hypothetical protein KAJ78_04090 [Acidobacteria bacterium]|nr:hypothetical protein [Acidobacteriota bacterium]